MTCIRRSIVIAATSITFPAAVACSPPTLLDNLVDAVAIVEAETVSLEVWQQERWTLALLAEDPQGKLQLAGASLPVDEHSNLLRPLKARVGLRIVRRLFLEPDRPAVAPTISYEHSLYRPVLDWPRFAIWMWQGGDNSWMCLVPDCRSDRCLAPLSAAILDAASWLHNPQVDPERIVAWAVAIALDNDLYDEGLAILGRNLVPGSLEAGRPRGLAQLMTLSQKEQLISAMVRDPGNLERLHLSLLLGSLDHAALWAHVVQLVHDWLLRGTKKTGDLVCVMWALYATAISHDGTGRVALDTDKLDEMLQSWERGDFLRRARHYWADQARLGRLPGFDVPIEWYDAEHSLQVESPEEDGRREHDDDEGGEVTIHDEESESTEDNATAPETK